MLTLNTLLEGAGISPSEVIVARHTPKEPSLRRVIRSIVAERPDLFRTFQSVQAERLEGAMTRRGWMASFLDDGPTGAIFAGLFQVGVGRRVSQAEFQAEPGNAELLALGMDETWTRDPLMFPMSDCEELSGWIGKLCIAWPGNARSWWRLADRNVFTVEALHAESAFSRGMPPWEEIVLSWGELQLLPASWRARLSEWRGIYYIFDAKRERGYVGSAYGSENLLGRWRNYAVSGHGGNVELRASHAPDLRFSILQRTSPDMLPEDVIALEGRWKSRLHTRAHGLNVN